MQLNPSEISELIKSRIQNLDTGAQMRTQGTVVSVTDGICRIHGLSDAMQGEMLEFPKNTFGLALNLERDSVGAVILGQYEHISEGDTVKCTGRILDVPVGPELIGRVVNSLGEPIDGKGPVNAKMTDVIEKVAPGVIARQSVSQPVQTGLKSIDSMVPIGRGQRELIIGDRQTGKTAVALDAILNQKETGVICIYNDLSKHAQAYREISLLLRRPPGREAYPGDVFYLHSRLLERAAKLNNVLGGGSLTSLPVIETQAGDLSAYIPTNVISITDGQIFLESDLFHQGVRPAINVGNSVSRVGGSAQIKAMRQVAGTLRLDLAQYRELAAFAQFGSDLDKATQQQLARGARLVEILKQPQYEPLAAERQVAIIYAGTNGHMDSVALPDVRAYETELYRFIESRYPQLFGGIREKKQLDDELKSALEKAVTDFTADF